MARWISRFASGTSASARTVQPCFSAACFSAGPPRSSYNPFEARSEMVMMPIWISIFLTAFEIRLCFRDQGDVRDPHLLVHRLAHVVNGQRGDADSRERLHFHAGLRRDPGRRRDGDAIPAFGN